NPPKLISQEFTLVITPPAGTAETWSNLSSSPLHPNYVFSALHSDFVEVLPPLDPNLSMNVTSPLTTVRITVQGAADNPAAVSAANYGEGLDVLKDVEDMNLLVIPDASSGDWVTIQKDMIRHCLLKSDRFAILDSRPNSKPTGNGSVEEQR